MQTMGYVTIFIETRTSKSALWQVQVVRANTWARTVIAAFVNTVYPFRWAMLQFRQCEHVTL